MVNIVGMLLSLPLSWATLTSALIWPLLLARSPIRVRGARVGSGSDLALGSEWTIPVYLWGIGNVLFFLGLFEARCCPESVEETRAVLELGLVASGSCLAAILILVPGTMLLFSRSSYRIRRAPWAVLFAVVTIALNWVFVIRVISGYW